MTDPAYVPSFTTPGSVQRTDSDWLGTFRSMASDINVRIVGDPAAAEVAFGHIETIFEQVEQQCTRFDQASDLMRANAAGTQPCAVRAYCYDALRAAQRAHELTDGRFDPRVLRALLGLGYDRSLPFAAGHVDVPRQSSTGSSRCRGRWQPVFEPASGSVCVGDDPIDLGGIGKGLAVRWAVEAIKASTPSFVLDAGGDCFLAGAGPDGHGWSVGVEDPHGGPDPVAVLSIRDAACATSSTRLRHWTAGGRPVHHLLDPRTGAPGGAGLRSVTVAGADAADAEVWTKALFLEGAAGIAAEAERRGLAALWVTEDHALGLSQAMRPHVIWQAS